LHGVYTVAERYPKIATYDLRAADLLAVKPGIAGTLQIYWTRQPRWQGQSHFAGMTMRRLNGGSIKIWLDRRREIAKMAPAY
jgi:hypothetical protein